LPAMLAEIPVVRRDDVPLRDARIVEYRRQSI
jgi:hypothetical protein